MDGPRGQRFESRRHLSRSFLGWTELSGGINTILSSQQPISKRTFSGGYNPYQMVGRVVFGQVRKDGDDKTDSTKPKLSKNDIYEHVEVKK